MVNNDNGCANYDHDPDASDLLFLPSGDKEDDDNYDVTSFITMLIKFAQRRMRK